MHKLYLSLPPLKAFYNGKQWRLNMKNLVQDVIFLSESQKNIYIVYKTFFYQNVLSNQAFVFYQSFYSKIETILRSDW